MDPHSPPPPPRPLPQPVEETTRSSRTLAAKGQQPSETSGSKPRPALPQPFDTSVKSSEQSSRTNEKDITSRDPRNGITSKARSPLPQPIESTSHSTKPRRFAPQMIETSRRSRRNTDTTPCVTPTDRTDVVPGDQAHLPRHMRQPRAGVAPTPPVNSPIVSTDQVPQVPESKFSSSKLAERAPRRHSFRIPDLPAIKSTTENDSDDSTSAESDQTERRRKKSKKKKQTSYARESQDERFSGYLLELAANAAEKQLREQAMAAYPNENVHEPVDHYAVDRDSEEYDAESMVGKLSMDGANDGQRGDRKSGGRQRMESGSGDDLAEMRRYKEKLENQRQEEWVAEKQPELDRRASFKNSIAEGGLPKATEMAGAPPKAILGWQKDNEIKAQRNAASPPMAGQDLHFPRCLSPQPTRLDVHQYPSQTHNSGAETRQHTGLWTPSGGASRRTSMPGLWNGVNAASAQENLAPPRTIQTGLMTPSPERSDPFDTKPTPSFSSSHSKNSLPPSPPSSQEAPITRLDARLRREASLEAELNDAFVTQVYNYLSLGYPSLARPFDEELAKITATSMDELRKDDARCNTKGYVGAPEGMGLDVRGCREGACERWLALRKYVREWGRQQPEWVGHGEKGILGERSDGGWGATARKGSWAI